MENKNIIALAQLNSIVGDIEFNKNKIINNIAIAKENNANLLITPQSFLLGEFYGDILSRFPYLYKQTKIALDEIKKNTSNICICVGTIQNNCKNSVAIIENCEIVKIINENSKIKDRIFEFNNLKYGFIFDENIEDIANNCDVLIDNRVYYTKCGVDKIKFNYLKQIAKKYSKKILFINQVGANDEFVFRGMSSSIDENGNIVALAKEFCEDLLILKNFNGKIEPILNDIEFNYEKKEDFSLDYEYDLKRTYNSIICAIKEYFSKNNIKRATLGLSGGLDSTICAVLLADALGKENVLGVFMPSKLTSTESHNDAWELAKNLGIKYIEAPIKTMHDITTKEFEEIFSKITWGGKFQKSYTQDNIQARSRAMILWGISNEYSSCIPIATSDKSEIYMGYATINGDMSGGFAPIADVCKTKLFALAKWLNKNRKIKNAIPENIILKPPGAELAIDEKTGKTLKAEDALMPYEFMDEIIYRIENLGQNKNDLKNIKFLYEKNNKISAIIKDIWLEKFFQRYNTAAYKWYISAPSPIIDFNSINKAIFKQPISSNIKY